VTLVVAREEEVSVWSSSRRAIIKATWSPESMSIRVPVALIVVPVESVSRRAVDVTSHVELDAFRYVNALATIGLGEGAVMATDVPLLHSCQKEHVRVEPLPEAVATVVPVWPVAPTVQPPGLVGASTAGAPVSFSDSRMTTRSPAAVLAWKGTVTVSVPES
jgi:hypothetical protein